MNTMTRVLLMLIAALTFTGASGVTRQVYQLDINDEIGSVTWRHTRAAQDEASVMGHPLLLLHLNTDGG